MTLPKDLEQETIWFLKEAVGNAFPEIHESWQKNTAQVLFETMMLPEINLDQAEGVINAKEKVGGMPWFGAMTEEQKTSLVNIMIVARAMINQKLPKTLDEPVIARLEEIEFFSKTPILNSTDPITIRMATDAALAQSGIDVDEFFLKPGSKTGETATAANIFEKLGFKSTELATVDRPIPQSTQEEFEEMIAERDKELDPPVTYNFAKDDKNNYLSKEVAAEFIAYRRAFKQFLGMLRTKYNIKGPYIIARCEPNGLITGHKPVMHKTLELANAEKDRLTKKHNKRFLVYGRTD